MSPAAALGSVTITPSRGGMPVPEVGGTPVVVAGTGTTSSAPRPVRLVGAPVVSPRVVVGGVARRRRGVARRARLVATGARRLQEARGREAERHAAGDDRPRLPAPEVLEVAQDRVAVGALQVVAERLGALGGLLGELRRLVLALLAQLVGDAADVGRGGADLLARLRRALVDLVADPARRLALGLLRLLLRFLLGLLRAGARPIGRGGSSKTAHGSPGLPSGAVPIPRPLRELTTRQPDGAYTAPVTGLTATRQTIEAWVAPDHDPSN